MIRQVTNSIGRNAFCTTREKQLLSKVSRGLVLEKHTTSRYITSASTCIVCQRSSTATSDQQPATSDQRPATSDQRPATSDQRPATSDQRPVTSDQRQRPATATSDCDQRQRPATTTSEVEGKIKYISLETITRRNN